MMIRTNIAVYPEISHTLKIGTFAYKLGRFQDAHQYYQEATEKNEEFALFFLARVLFDLDQIQRSNQIYFQGLKQFVHNYDPDNLPYNRDIADCGIAEFPSVELKIS